jgi:hypothetical protein
MGKKIYDADLQLLTIAYAKDIGLDESGYIEGFNSNAVRHADVGLAPILVYSVVAPAYSVFARRLVDPRDPLSISAFLAWAWSSQSALSIPNSLEVKQRLIEADRGYRKWLDACEITISTPSSVKSLTAFERVSLDVRFAVQWGDVQRKGQSRSLEMANNAIREYDVFRASMAQSYSMDQLTYEAWRDRDKRYFNGACLNEDWDMRVIPEVATERAPEMGMPGAGDLVPVLSTCLNELVDMWPGGKKPLFKQLGITQKEFKLWTQGGRDLSQAVRSRLFHKLNFIHDPLAEEWELGGGYLLVASKQRATSKVYDDLAHGGDLRFSVELLGPHGEMASHRFLIFQSWGGDANIILFKRGGPEEKWLTESCLINFGGPVYSTPAVWASVNEVVETCNRLQAPEVVATLFAEMHEGWLGGVEQVYGKYL